MVLTVGVHKVLKRSPNRDVRELLGTATPTILSGLTRRMARSDDVGPFALLCGAVPSLRFDPERRAALGQVLTYAQRAAQERCPTALYALCFCGGAPSGPRASWVRSSLTV